MDTIKILDKNGTFQLDDAENTSGLYFPIASETGLKSSITPNLGGDAKIAQTSFLMEPVSIENLHNNRSTRNFWCMVDGQRPWSATGASAEAENDRDTENQEDSTLTAGFLWQKVERTAKNGILESEITSFVPYNANVELMIVKITNTSERVQAMSAVAAIPIYGRSADNIRDHRNVTSMLHRISTTEDGVVVKPTMSFDERGHLVNHTVYYVLGAEEAGLKPAGFIPVAETFLGEGGTFTHPVPLYKNEEKTLRVGAGASYEGKEAVGAICFRTKDIEPGATRSFVIMMGIGEDTDDLSDIALHYGSVEKAEKALEETKAYWKKMANVDFHAGSPEYDNFLKWVSFQPFLRAIYGCSFLPHHDYGRGGRGWRDLWQDCLSLLIMDPKDVRANLLNNIRGVRIDGTNATIIGSKPGEFIADRNGIARVWMDHGVWPFKTIMFYIHQTGDFSILKEMAPYFKDAQIMRGNGIDVAWDESEGLLQKTDDGKIYEGSILEHILLEHLTSYYEVGEHGMLRLRGADWNDAIDMAADRGESVAFTAAYAGNLAEMASLLRKMAKEGITELKLLLEIKKLIQPAGKIAKDGVTDKTFIDSQEKILHGYLAGVTHAVSGQTEKYSTEELADSLETMAESLKARIRSQEWIQQDEENGWYNSYYDNSGKAVERKATQGQEPRMMLTGQVFTIMSGTADAEHTKKICHAADEYLYQKEIGGYRLNTNFHELKFDMGRMFGFAYGDKENGAVFSHMTVMYANALYGRGLVREGYKALQSLADASMDFEISRIYPGIPEYFRADGRGMYHYLTGAASWYLMTMVTKVFGVCGEYGNLIVKPQLVAEQFDAAGEASISLVFAGKKIAVNLHNPNHLDFGAYKIASIKLDDKDVTAIDEGTGAPVITKAELEKLAADTEHVIEIELQ